MIASKVVVKVVSVLKIEDTQVTFACFYCHSTALADGEFTDLTLAYEDSRHVHAHKAVLCSSSRLKLL